MLGYLIGAACWLKNHRGAWQWLSAHVWRIDGVTSKCQQFFFAGLRCISRRSDGGRDRLHDTLRRTVGVACPWRRQSEDDYIANA
jgi:hypothetical protein